MELHSKDAVITLIFDKALDEHNAGNLSAAKEMYHEILAIQPDHCEANHNIGIVLVAENEYDKALDFFKFALHTSPIQALKNFYTRDHTRNTHRCFILYNHTYTMLFFQLFR